MKKLLIILCWTFALASEPFQITVYDLAHIVAKENGLNIVIDEDLGDDVTLFFSSPIEGQLSFDTFKILIEKKGFELERVGAVYFLQKPTPKEAEFSFLAVDIPLLSPEKVIELAGTLGIEAKQMFNSAYLLKYPADSLHLTDTLLNVTRQFNNRYVRLTGEIIELSNDDLKAHGLDFAFLVESVNRFGDLDLNFFSSINQNSLIKSFMKQDKNKINLVGFLNFLKENGIARTITTPNLLVANAERSKFHSGQKIPVKGTSTTFQNGIQSPYTTANYNYLEVGLIIDVGARIFNQVIELDFKLDHITIDRYVENEQVISSNKSFHSKFNLLNKKRVVIAGLSKETEAIKRVAVPFVSEIPFLGNLFRSEYTTKNNTSLIILLTADIEVI